MLVAEAVLVSWRFEPLEILVLALSLAVYLRGFLRVQRQMPDRFPSWRAVSFGTGLFVVFIAVASPLDTFASFLLWTHMVQHFLLMFVAPPLIWLGAPAVPILRGLPIGFVRDLLGPFLAARRVRLFLAYLAHPVVCWISFVAVTWIWHIPALYELALRDSFWHATEHILFFTAALLFWWPLVQPWPSKARWPRIAMVPYLLAANVQASALSAFFSFRSTVVYDTYARAPRISSVSPLEDQSLAGALMWVPGSVVVLVALFGIVIGALSPSLVRRPDKEGDRSPRTAMLAAMQGRERDDRFDVLRVPGLGRLLASLRARRVAQMLLFGLAFLIVADGLFGPPESGRNLAGVLPWTYWRGFVVVALLIAGNFFCMVCPFLLPRELARRFLPAGRRWPRVLRSKWCALALLLGYLVAYEVLGIWDSPYWTAWIVVGYFAGALLVDSIFRGAPFCKWLCPIGQFHFVQSMVSPLTVEVRDPPTCASCRTRDCLVGNEQSRGCELDLYLPRKVGSLDCTFCLDCVRACPHDNIGLLATVPGAEISDQRPRASLGTLAKRVDVGLLALLLVAAAFVSAAAMTSPFVRLEEDLATYIGSVGTAELTGLLLVALLVVVPLIAVALAAAFAQRLGGLRTSVLEVANSFVFALVPLGLAMWGAHFLFHFVAGWDSIFPVAVRGLRDLGAQLAQPVFVLGHASHGMEDIGLLLLDLGLLATLWRVWQRAQQLAPDLARASLVALPWSAIAVGLFLTGVWLTYQPMEMRGLVLASAG